MDSHVLATITSDTEKTIGCELERDLGYSFLEPKVQVSSPRVGSATLTARPTPYPSAILVIESLSLVNRLDTSSCVCSAFALLP